MITAQQKQLDWRWVDTFRQLTSYNSFQWLAHAGPFTEEEQGQWDRFADQQGDEATQKQKEQLLEQSRTRELAAALAEQREPRLWYPAIPIREVQERLRGFAELDAAIDKHEPNAVVRHLYQAAIAERVWFLRLIEASHNGDCEQFRVCNDHLYPTPTQQELGYLLSRIKHILLQGFVRETTREVSLQIAHLLEEQLRIKVDLSWKEDEAHDSVQEDISLVPSPQAQQSLSSEAAKRFLEAVFSQRGYDGWQILSDPHAQGPRIEAGLRQFFLPEKALTLAEIKSYLEHELDHIERAVRGERSPLGLLAIGCAGYMATNEGLALYHEMQAAVLQGRAFDESRIWLSSLAVALARGGETSPQTFRSLYLFLKPFLVLYRLLRRPDEDEATAHRRAHQLALNLCLRVFRGVPDLHEAGICFMKDWLYVHGWLKVRQAVRQNATILDWLEVGRVALEDLADIERLGILPPATSLRSFTQDPALDAYMLSFESPSSQKG